MARVQRCVTLSYVKTATITIRLDHDLERELDRACAQTGRTRSDLARDALRRQLTLLRFDRLRKRTLPLAEAQTLGFTSPIFATLLDAGSMP